ncbi:efflux RND transporter periplasmic adaptor subunit [Paenibacillus sp. CGMCC 1.16610]|uniref:Efflux RND transporter periplasmic adaptor subunit n=1 Tax=Paenibacillus anseongense TaxID=2682845 RepID=A0ABW9U5I4_9BACL|nr:MULTISPECIES: efflux RND transporter periplasmic adaptor subunit [Paenibacillus]MBA2938709.1 efflux RND transporter periplasmic adaptor subunit [Paenibacillus sp. CGMCC 1.16610]MVQ34672.1 efflux RND transporter periplasmic adaptor subunit [Paenibacillus anseongense]
MNRLNQLIVPAVFVLATLTVLPACGAIEAEESGASGVPVQVIKLGQGATAGLNGKIIPDQSINIVSKASGKVAEVRVQEGSKVKKGDVLVQLETSELTQQVKQAEYSSTAAQAKLADTQAGARTQEITGLQSSILAAGGAYQQTTAAVEQAKAGLDLATSSYNRLRNAFESSSSVSQDDLDKGTLDYEKAKAGYEQALGAQKSAEAQLRGAEAKLELAKVGPTENTIKALQADVERLNATLELANSGLSNATITAPIDGVIVKKGISPGELAQAGVQILSLVNMDQVQVELSVMDSQITQVKEGMAVAVKVQNVPDKSFQGVISFVSPVANTNSNTFPVKVKVDNKDGLLFAGMVAEVQLNAAQMSRLEVPKSAVVKKDQKEYLFTAEGSTAHLVEVKTEEKNQDWLYVMPNDKIKANQQIIVKPADNLAEGTKVKAE